MKVIKKLLFLLMILGLIIVSCNQKQQSRPATDASAVLGLANAYYTNGLYEAAARQYLDYLKTYKPDAKRRANTYYTVGNIYFERVHDYRKALIYYFKVKYLYPESNLQNEVGKRIVNCLERLEKSTDAQRVLEKEAALEKNQVKENKPGEVVATIGQRKITQGDLNFEISQLPNYLQDEFKNKKKKKAFLQQYILNELLYDSAKRKGLDKDKEVIEAAFRAKKSLMAQKLLNEELQKKVEKVKPEDVELYYKAHKDRYTEKDKKGKVKRQKSLAEVQQQVAQDLMRERQQSAYRQLAERLMKAENVKIYDSRIK